LGTNITNVNCGFVTAYNDGGRLAGTYIFANGIWTRQ